MTTTTTKAADVTVERTIPAPPSEVFEAWLDPKIPGTPWHEHQKLIVDRKVDGLWYWLTLGNTPHYGRFLEIERPARIRYSWMSANTLGQESIVTVTFEKKGDDTLLTLVHAGLPNEAMVKAHEKGWSGIVDELHTSFGSGARRK
jgi:uncharacterized protein YndB with AHSA1/START domain